MAPLNPDSLRMEDATDASAGGDDRLLARAQGGDREAFASIMEAHLERVWNLVWRVLRHQEDTEDVVQEVFLSAWQSLPGFRGEARLSTWLQKIAVSRALNHRGRASERLRRASVPLEDPIEDDARTRPLRQLEDRELRRRLSECLQRLPGPWRAVLALRLTEASSYDQIAAALEVAIGTVRSRLARARLALRDCVEGRT